MSKRKLLNQVIILSILWLALLTRLSYLAYINEAPTDGMLFAPLCGVDAHIYDQYGQDFLLGQWPGAEPLFRTPLYTLYLGIIYGATGINHYLPLILQTLIHTVAAAALYKTGQFVFSRQAGWLAAAGYAFYGSLIFYAGCFAQISLVLPLLILSLFFLCKFQFQGNQIRYLVLAGLAISLASLGRPTILAILPAVVIWLFLYRQTQRQWLGYAAIFTVIAFIPLLPVTIFNFTVSGKFIPVSTNGPEVLFISNNPDAEGRDILGPGIEQPVHQRLGQVVSQIRQGKTSFTQEVVNYIIADPVDWLRLEAKKAWLLFGKPDLNLLTIAYAYPTTTQQIAVFGLMPVQWPGLILLALLGMIFTWNKRASLLFLSSLFITLVTIIFFVQLRFRLLLVPFVLLYAAAFLASAPALFRAKRSKYYLILAILLFCIPFASGIWLFAAIFMGIGVWQSIKLDALQYTKWPLLTSWALFILAILGAQIINSTVLGQREDYYYGPEIIGDLFLGQTFQPDCNGLNKISLTLGIYQATHNQAIEFHLRSLTSNQEIFTEQFSAQNLSDRTVKTFILPAQPESSQHTYLAYLTSPTSHPGNSITIRGFSDLPVDWYPSGTAIAGQANQTEPLPGDLAFEAACNTNIIQKIQNGFGQMRGPAWLYWLLLVGHIMLLFAAITNIVRLRLR